MSFKVSVLIPVYNQEGLITRALESIPKRKDIEVLVYDDGSTDKTLDKILEFQKGTKLKTNILSCAHNKGVAFAMNWMYDNARGDFVVALGSDDYFTEGFEKVVDELDDNYDIVYFDLETNDGTIFHLDEETKEGYCGSTKFINREFLGNTRCPNKKAGEDYFFYQDLLKKHPVEKFTGIIAKHYNYPREGSLSWLQRNKLIENE